MHGLSFVIAFSDKRPRKLHEGSGPGASELQSFFSS